MNAPNAVKDTVVLITGAASGIGLEIAKTFARHGAKVMLTDVKEEEAFHQAQLLAADGYRIAAQRCDVTREDDIRSAVDATVSRFGCIDTLINNAGLQYVSLIENFPVKQFELMVKIMLTAPFIAIQNVFPLMKKQGGGRIINMASINGLIGFAGKAAYNSAKHGVIGLTKVAALEGAAYGITVNAICPGYVDTALVRGQFEDLARTRNTTPERILEEVIFPLVPQKRLIGMDEIAACALYLAGEAAKGITGQAMVIDGGYTVQ